MQDLERLFRSAQGGDVEAAKQLTALLYEELRLLARREMAGERSSHTLQPTALANEAYLRLVDAQGGTYTNRTTFIAAAATVIRRVLVDHARGRAREKRGGGSQRVPLEGLELAAPMADEEILALDQALAELAGFDARKARIVELRFFAGLSVEELCTLLGASESTVRREWRMARAWLRTYLEEHRGS